jgi:hypothetical protein
MQCSEPPSIQISCDIHSTVNHSKQSGILFATLHLLCTPSTKTWYTSQQIFILYFKLIYITTF